MYMTEIEDIEKGLIVTFTGGEVQGKDDIGEEFGHYVTAMANAKWKANTAMPMCYPGPLWINSPDWGLLFQDHTRTRIRNTCICSFHNRRT